MEKHKQKIMERKKQLKIYAIEVVTLSYFEEYNIQHTVYTLGFIFCDC